jgi:hypothetical protein
MTSTLWKKRRPLGGDIARVPESISAEKESQELSHSIHTPYVVGDRYLYDGGDTDNDTGQFIVVIATDNLLLNAFHQELYLYGQGIFIAIDVSWLY